MTTPLSPETILILVSIALTAIIVWASMYAGWIKGYEEGRRDGIAAVAYRKSLEHLMDRMRVDDKECTRRTTLKWNRGMPAGSHSVERMGVE